MIATRAVRHSLTVRIRRVVLTFLPASLTTDSTLVWTTSLVTKENERKHTGPRYGGFGAIFVCRYGWGGEGGGIVEFFIICPVWAAVVHISGQSSEYGEEGGTDFAILDMMIRTEMDEIFVSRRL